MKNNKLLGNTVRILFTVCLLIASGSFVYNNIPLFLTFFAGSLILIYVGTKLQISISSYVFLSGFVIIGGVGLRVGHGSLRIPESYGIDAMTAGLFMEAVVFGLLAFSKESQDSDTQKENELSNHERGDEIQTLRNDIRSLNSQIKKIQSNFFELDTKNSELIKENKDYSNVFSGIANLLKRHRRQ